MLYCPGGRRRRGQAAVRQEAGRTFVCFSDRLDRLRREPLSPAHTRVSSILTSSGTSPAASFAHEIVPVHFNGHFAEVISPAICLFEQPCADEAITLRLAFA